MSSCCKAIPQNIEVAPSTPEQTSCCNGKTVSRENETLEKLCRIGLAFFAYAVDPLFSVIGIASGIVAGASTHIYALLKHQQPPSEGYRRPVCAQGYMETLSGRSFSPAANLLATALFIATHIMHYPPFFVPFTSFFVGMWLGGGTIDMAWKFTHPQNVTV